MTLDRRLTRAAHQIADGLNPPEVDLDAVRARARSNRRRTTSLAVAATAVAVIAVGVTVVDGRDTSEPSPPVAPPDACASSPREEPTTAPTNESILAAQREWITDLPAGTPPMTPWWHDGVLHVRDAEIETPFQVKLELIEVAGDAVLVGDPTWDDRTKEAEWAVVRGDRLEELPTGDGDAHLSVDGRIAYWFTDPEANTGRVVTWDVETNRELTTRDLQGYLLGIDDNGIAYVRGLEGDSSVTEWDIRADTMAPSDLTWDPSKTSSEQCSSLPGLGQWRLTRGYVSPDGTREVFTGPAQGDTSTDCCTTQLRVRPVGPIESVDPSEVTTLPLPEGIPHMTLWQPYSDRGTWGVWWESNQTVLLDAVIDGHSYLVRCSTTGGACERVFDLGPGSNPPHGQGALYDPAWHSEWAFAHAPVTD